MLANRRRFPKMLVLNINRPCAKYFCKRKLYYSLPHIGVLQEIRNGLLQNPGSRRPLSFANLAGKAWPADCQNRFRIPSSRISMKGTRSLSLYLVNILTLSSAWDNLAQTHLAYRHNNGLSLLMWHASPIQGSVLWFAEPVCEPFPRLCIGPRRPEGIHFRKGWVVLRSFFIFTWLRRSSIRYNRNCSAVERENVH
jgi:hypothetical protein